MRFFRPAVLALAATSATASSLTQYKPRSLIDVCADVDANIVIPGLIPIVLGHIHICLCASAIPGLLHANVVVEAAVVILGETAVTALLTALINAASGHQTCHFPDHAVPHCTHDNPCDFTCKDGYTPYPTSHPTECVCNSPNTVCNGVCGYFPHCASQKVKRDATWRDTTCPHGWSACGVWGGNGLDYECVDVRKDLWSCGGCGLPLLSTDPTGVDCTAIVGVHDVACRTGRCTVERCKEGFEVSSDRSACVPNTRTRPHNPAFINNANAHY